MSLIPGARLGPFEIGSPLGQEAVSALESVVNHFVTS